MIRVCVVDDQTLVRSAFRSLLGTFDGIEVVAEASDGDAAITAVAQSHPDVLLLDVRMPKRSGIEVIRELASKNELPPTLLLTTFDDDAALVAGVKAGARGYLLKGVTPEVLVEAIRIVANGGTYLYAPLAMPMPEGAPRPDISFDPNELTMRERDVLRLLVSGISNREIAEALVLSEGTVRNHISSIFSKMGVNDRTRAVLQAITLRIV
jgi:DNA-binding NarL/FixJ family response regulator